MQKGSQIHYDPGLGAMPVVVRFTQFPENGFADMTKCFTELLVSYGYDFVITEGDDYDVLVHNCSGIVLKKGAFYVAGLKASLNRHPAKTLIFSSESSERIQALPWVLRKFVRLSAIIRWSRRLPVILDKLKLNKVNLLSKYSYKLLGWFYYEKAQRQLRAGQHALFYYRPAFSRYVQQLPGPNNYAILTNTAQTNREANIFSLPFFFHHCLNEVDRFVELKQKRLYEDKTKFCAFVVSNDGHPAILGYLRIWFCMALSKYKKVDCYGPVLNNKTITAELLARHSETKRSLAHFTEQDIDRTCRDTYHPDCGWIDRWGLNQELFRDYKFVICFENSMAADYITEKLPNVMLGNSIGIYHGAPNIGEYFNPSSFINCAEYPDYQAVIQRIIALDQDDAAYFKMLREPFFADNQIPAIIANKKAGLKKFLDNIFLRSPEDRHAGMTNTFKSETASFDKPPV